MAELFPVSFTGRGGETGERTALSLVRKACASPSSPPGFPGMTFSLGNHFLRTSTAIFIFNSFRKSCLARVNAAIVSFTLKTAPTARRACTYSSRRQAPSSRAAPRLCVRPRRLSKQRQRTCTLFRPSCFPSVVGT